MLQKWLQIEGQKFSGFSPAVALINWVEVTSEESLHQASIGFPEEKMTAYEWLKFGIIIDVREHIGEIKAIKARQARRSRS